MVPPPSITPASFSFTGTKRDRISLARRLLCCPIPATLHPGRHQVDCRWSTNQDLPCPPHPPPSSGPVFSSLTLLLGSGHA
ncbi:hypothetical protein Y1Q_0001379 [Alligator mississippiensis]|uniref:Uncharacterized protein n=1 Tax=Alligator mississippiensis TaxID=8496 RepID=A0A151M985_ALLMI|nr:hypothetical protein Y1Q_0001379 [Alligator mississippiensis]